MTTIWNNIDALNHVTYVKISAIANDYSDGVSRIFQGIASSQLISSKTKLNSISLQPS